MAAVACPPLPARARSPRVGIGCFSPPCPEAWLGRASSTRRQAGGGHGSWGRSAGQAGGIAALDNLKPVEDIVKYYMENARLVREVRGERGRPTIDHTMLFPLWTMGVLAGALAAVLFTVLAAVL